ncbi:hypothetical protein M513_13634, partial [Trichuris suis]
MNADCGRGLGSKFRVFCFSDIRFEAVECHAVFPGTLCSRTANHMVECGNVSDAFSRTRKATCNVPFFSRYFSISRRIPWSASVVLLAFLNPCWLSVMCMMSLSLPSTIRSKSSGCGLLVELA